jgi:hypothetical protein
VVREREGERVREEERLLLRKEKIAFTMIVTSLLTLYRKSHLCSPKKGIYVFPEKGRGLSPNSYIHVSVSDLYIPRIGPHIWLQQKRQTDPRNI